MDVYVLYDWSLERRIAKMKRDLADIAKGILPKEDDDNKSKGGKKI